MAGEEPRSYLVECYWPGVSEERLAAAARRAEEAAARVREQGRRLFFVSSILVPLDETAFCLFDGNEADVRAASESAGLPFERILESIRIDGNDGRRSQ